MSDTCSHQTTINHLKAIIIDAVQSAQSGHIAGELTALDITYYLFTECLRYDPDDPNWQLRDRFILSVGHASMLLYSMLYAIGYLQKRDLQEFRQLGSITHGHPDIECAGVECTTGQLGQGAGMSVGFAVARLHHQHSISPVFDQQVVVLLGDGCMQEDITLSSASYAGHLALPNLTWIYDRNGKQISGDTAMVESNDWEKIYQGCGWQVITIDGHDHRQIKTALACIHTKRRKPLLIISNTTHCKGTFSVEGNHIYHGMPLPEDEVIQTKRKLNLPMDKQFYFPDTAKRTFQRNFAAMRERVQNKKQDLADLQTSSRFKFHYHADASAAPVPVLTWESAATRDALGRLIAHYAKHLPLLGGSADLNDPTRVSAFISQVGEFNRHCYHGRGLQFGVREMPMSAICNGIALHGGYLVFDATFLCFSDYSRAAIRSGAIQKANVLHIFTHDSFLLGEDGTTHHPIEQLMSLRAMPNLQVIRPADGRETEALFLAALESDLPTAFCLTRQSLPALPQTSNDARRGAYAMTIGEDLLIIATGSEVSLALQSAELLAREHNIYTQVVSMPCWELFAMQSKDYQDSVLPPQHKRRVAIEAGISLGWERYVGTDGLCISIEEYGRSGKMQDLAEFYGFTATQVTARILAWL